MGTRDNNATIIQIFYAKNRKKKTARKVRDICKKYGKKISGIFGDADARADSTRVSFRPDGVDPARAGGRRRNAKTVFRRENVRWRAFERTFFGQSGAIRK